MAERIRLELVPMHRDEAIFYIQAHHRHLKKTNLRQGYKFALAACMDDRIVGVVMVGRPVAGALQDGWTLEVTRLCSNGERNVCSFLYGAAWRAARALGYRRLGTYTLTTEPGTSLRAAGWRLIGQTRGGSWDRRERPRVDKHPLQAKLRWERSEVVSG